MQFQLERHGAPQVKPEFLRVGDDKVIGSTLWVNETGNHVERYQVLTIRDGKIVDMQGCRSLREAERIAGRGG